MFYAHVRTKGELDREGLINRICERGVIPKPDIVMMLIILEEVVSNGTLQRGGIRGIPPCSGRVKPGMGEFLCL